MKKKQKQEKPVRVEVVQVLFDNGGQTPVQIEQIDYEFASYEQMLTHLSETFGEQYEEDASRGRQAGDYWRFISPMNPDRYDYAVYAIDIM